MSGRFDPVFEELPAVLPVFPLTGIVLLPRGKLPLNIFEPRYLAMTRHALGGDRLIGMIQPTDPRAGSNTGPPAGGSRAGEAAEPPPLYRTGCAGRITA